jgi:hypothetical protein
MAATERIPLLVTPTQKALFAKPLTPPANDY